MITVVTSIHKAGMEVYGLNMLNAVDKYWADDINFICWYHDFDIFDFDVPTGSNITYRNLNNVQDMLDYRERMATHDGTHGGRSEYNWRLDAIKWCHKVFAMTEEAFEMSDSSVDPGWLVWLDADTVTNKPMCAADLEHLLPEDKSFVHLGRKDTDYSETSFMGFNLKFEDPLHMLGDLRGCYNGGEVVAYREWHDGFIIERLLNIYRAHGMAVENLTPKAEGLDAFGQSPLAQWMTHFKGNKKFTQKTLSDTEVSPDVTGPQRYKQLSKLVKHYKARNVVEIGTWNGGRAIEMALSAFSVDDIHEFHYWGFDLFEEATEESDEYEMNSKGHNTVKAVHHRLTEFAEKMAEEGNLFTFQLMKGDTKETLKDFDITGIDLTYIDGGHSYETCKSDYMFLKDVPVVVFDDFFSKDPKGLIAPKEHQGTNQVMEEIEGLRRVALPSQDRVNGGGITHLGVVLHEGVADVPTELLHVPIVITPKDCMPTDYIRNNIIKNHTIIPKNHWDCVYTAGSHLTPAIIVSGGHIDFEVLKNTMEINPDAPVVCVKHAFPRLMEAGIVPDYCVILDPRPVTGISTHGIKRKSLFKKLSKKTKFFVASMTDPSVTRHLKRLKGKIYGWHAYTDAIIDPTEIGKSMKIHPDLPIKEGTTLITGGTSAAMRSIGMFHVFGFRTFHLFGFDCSIADEVITDKMHKETEEDGRPKHFKVEIDGDHHWTTGELLAMAQDCEKLFERTDIDMRVFHYSPDSLIGSVLRISKKAKELQWEGIK